MTDIDECEECHKPIGWDRWLEMPCGSLLHRHCFDDYEQNQAEAAHDRWLEDYYGGDAPCTDEERYQAAAAERRRMDGL